MPQDFINIAYQIQFETPFHLGTGLRRGLLDRSVCRDVNGYLYIPGSTLKGVLREKCEQIARVFLIFLLLVHTTSEKQLIVSEMILTSLIGFLVLVTSRVNSISTTRISLRRIRGFLIATVTEFRSDTSTSKQRHGCKQVFLGLSAQCANKRYSKANSGSGRSVLKGRFMVIWKASVLMTKTNGVIHFFCSLLVFVPMTRLVQTSQRGWVDIVAKF